MAFSEQIIQKVWEKATVDTHNNPNIYRKDQCTAWIRRDAYGNRNTQYGWEIDHIKPVSEGGGDELTNLRPLQWENNVNKQADRLTCPVISSGTLNVYKK